METKEETEAATDAAFSSTCPEVTSVHEEPPSIEEHPAATGIAAKVKEHKNVMESPQKEKHSNKDDSCEATKAEEATKPPPPPMNPWSRRKDPSPNNSSRDVTNSSHPNAMSQDDAPPPPSKSLTQIMKEQEVESLQTRQTATAIIPKSARSVTFGDARVVNDLESEEERMIRLAIEASLQDQDVGNPSATASVAASALACVSTTSSRSAALPPTTEEEGMDDDIKLAIRLSMQDAAVMTTTSAYKNDIEDYDDDDVPELLGYNYVEESGEEDRKMSAVSMMPAGASSSEENHHYDLTTMKHILSELESKPSSSSISPPPATLLKSNGLDEYESDPTMTTVGDASSSPPTLYPNFASVSAASTVSSSVSATSTASLGASTASTATESTTSTAITGIHGTASMPPSRAFLTQEEEEQIARAIRDADHVETANSLRLAMELQKQEEELYQQTQVEQRRAREGNAQSPFSKSAHVRMVTDGEFQDLKMAATAAGISGGQEEADFDSDEYGFRNSTSGERQLWGKDDYEDHQNYYDGEINRQHQDEESNNKGDAFRINSKAPSKAWSRVDKNTIVGPNNEIRTKHDVTLKNLSNAHRLLGDKADTAKKGGKISVGDAAYNSFHRSIKNSMKRRTVKGVAAHGHGRAENMNAEKTRGGAMDGNVRLLISKAINNGLISRCNGVVKEGKEAIVYHADCGTGQVEGEHFDIKNDRFDVAVKVFKRIQEFKGRSAYIDNDNRYHGQKFKNVDKRAQVEQWTEKEFRNLIRANKGGVPVPSPIMYKENILFMRFLGENGWPSPQLREVELKHGSKRWRALYCQTVVAIRKLYWCSRLVHADLSEYNILVCPMGMVENALDKSPSAKEDVQIVLIDFGQAVERNHPSALDLLRRDISHVREFFVKKGIDVMSIHDTEKVIVIEPEIEFEESLDEQDESDLNDVKTFWRHYVKGWNDSTEISVIEEELKNLGNRKEP